jgi:transposase
MRTTSGKRLYRRLIFNNTREGFETLLLQVEAVRVQHGLKEVVFGMEPTANYHKPLGEFLINQEQQVILVSPEAVKHNRPLLDGRWNKHDGKDCANIADLMCQGKCLFYEYPVFGAARSAQPVIAQQKAQEARTGTTAAHPQSSGGAVLPRDGSVLSLGSQ